MYKRLLDDLHEAGITRVSMEFPKNWKKQIELLKILDPFFSELAEYAEKKGMAVIGIDSPELARKYSFAGVSLDLKKLYPQSELEQLMRQIRARKSQTDPKEARWDFLDFQEKSLSLALNRTEGELVEETTKWHVKRDAFMAEELKKTGFQAIIVGDAHAVALSKRIGQPVIDYGGVVARVGAKRGQKELLNPLHLKKYRRERTVQSRESLKSMPKPRLPK